jgi:hypothetical protein
MNNLSINIVEVSGFLQSLTMPEYSSKVETAVEKNDKEALLVIFNRAKIPNKYFSTIMTALFSMASPQQKYPEFL